MKILLLGKGGQVGWELQRSLAPLGELVALDAEERIMALVREVRAARVARVALAVCYAGRTENENGETK